MSRTENIPVTDGQKYPEEKLTWRQQSTTARLIEVFGGGDVLAYKGEPVFIAPGAAIALG